MYKYSVLLLILATIPTFAGIKTFVPQEGITAADINNNFNEVKQVLDQKNTPINFSIFQSGTVIYKDNFEAEFDKVRNLGVNIPLLESEYIIAQELNNIFAQTLLGVQTYDDQPVSSDINFTTDEDVSHLIVFSYVNNVGSSQVQIVSPPSNGTLSPSGNTYIYNPSSNYFGTDNFSYRIFDGVNTSNISNVGVTINSVNDQPVANAQILSTNEDVVLNITLTGSDIEVSALTYSIVVSPTNGELTGSGASRTYTPNENFNGSDSFTFKVNDGSLDSITKTVSITVNAVNDVPVANAQLISTNEDTPLSITLTGTDPEASALTYSIVSSPTNGSLTGTGASRTYTPNSNYNGSDSFTFRVNDGTDFSTTKTISITVNAVNDIPVANTQSLSTNEDTPLNIVLTGSDVEVSPLTYSIVSMPSNGTLTGSGINYQYTPNSNYNGSDIFTFKVNDGSIDSAAVAVSLNVIAVNDVPTISGNQNISIASNQTAANSTASGTDIEGTSLVYSVATAPTKGVVTSGSNGSYTYTANLNAFGSDSFSIRSFDGTGYSPNLTISVDISIPKSCKDLLALRPSLLNNDNTYYIDLDGAGSLTPAQVLCDMTTNSGGWTNIAANIGSFSNVLEARSNASVVAITNSGVSTSSVATSAIGGSLVSQVSDTIGGCMGTLRYLKLTSQILGYLNPSSVKMKVKSYGGGAHSCGGILRYSDLSIPAVVKISPTSFDSRTLARCDGGGTYPSTSTSVDLTFYTTFSDTNFATSKTIGVLEAQCGSGTSYVQYHQIWVR